MLNSDVLHQRVPLDEHHLGLPPKSVKGLLAELACKSFEVLTDRELVLDVAQAGGELPDESVLVALDARSEDDDERSGNLESQGW